MKSRTLFRIYRLFALLTIFSLLSTSQAAGKKNETFSSYLPLVKRDFVEAPPITPTHMHPYPYTNQNANPHSNLYTYPEQNVAPDSLPIHPRAP